MLNLNLNGVNKGNSKRSPQVGLKNKRLYNNKDKHYYYIGCNE